ncbi:MAG: UDP-N-acetylglucosamine--N-acetylmuramyl-(pentapeptide) pyrophosphoryl-undecaprenol N-acetylglucosamine transferase [Phycisphaerae bacterium]|nr:UDP-N-acetylglucosamine--N-acetylmuramyl-(pentapeptide) pyrophosphoryl-undecaprenol N-acetylglucosamine transferase [Phycisphaerae bacterium]
MSGKCFFFAGGGTGGHIYPAIAIAERMAKLEPEVKVRFFCSNRSVDLRILAKTDFVHASLPVHKFSLKPVELIKFCTSFLESFRIARRAFIENKDSIVIGVGGFVSAPVCLAARKLNIPIVLLNVDIVPGRANKIIARWADEIFVQFEDTRKCFAKKKAKVNVLGCPLRSGFDNPHPEKAIEQLGLDKNKKTLLITGASSGSESINAAICSLLENLNAFTNDWQIVHLTGRANFENVQKRYIGAKISHKVIDYFDDMPDLLSAADLVIGRSGAVSAAEYAAAGVPSICIPYPYHRDRHQYLNAGKLVQAGAAVIVDDQPKHKDMGGRLWAVLEELMKNDEKRNKLAENCKTIAKTQASFKIAEKLLKIGIAPQKAADYKGDTDSKKNCSNTKV